MSDLPLDIPTVRALAGSALESRPGSVVYADREPRAPGTLTLGGEIVSAEHPTLLVFRDEMPGANWMHPVTYALVDLTTHAVVIRVASDRPPVFGLLPDNWVVVSDPGQRADLVRPR